VPKLGTTKFAQLLVEQDFYYYGRQIFNENLQNSFKIVKFVSKIAIFGLLGGAYFPISSADGPLFAVNAPDGYSPGAIGGYSGQIFSGSAGDATTITVQGNFRELCDGTATYKAMLGGVSTTTAVDCADGSPKTSIDFTFTLPAVGAGNAADTYAISICDAADGVNCDTGTTVTVGTLYATSDVSTNANWILTPSEVSALDVLG
jgi:hypothetical protein